MTTAIATMATVEAARIICGSYPAASSLKTEGSDTRALVAPSLTIDAGSDAASDIDVGGERPTRVGHGALQRACIGAVH
jgi:hypothetical protein